MRPERHSGPRQPCLLPRCAVTDAQGCRAAHLPDVLQRVALVDDDPARRAGVVLLQVLDQAAPADCVQSTAASESQLRIKMPTAAAQPA